MGRSRKLFKRNMMARPKAKELTDRELEIMHVFWERGDLTAQAVRDELATNGRDLAYTTVATLIRILTEKGFLKQITEERPFLYQSVKSFEDVSSRFVTDMLQRVFGGSRELMLMCLMDQKKMNARERALLKDILQEKKK